MKQPKQNANASKENEHQEKVELEIVIHQEKLVPLQYN